MRLGFIIVALGLQGCAHRGLSYPGPLDSMATNASKQEQRSSQKSSARHTSVDNATDAKEAEWEDDWEDEQGHVGFWYTKAERRKYRGMPPVVDEQTSYDDDLVADTARSQDIDETTTSRRHARRRGTGGTAVAKSAGKLVGKNRLLIDGERYRYDCSGMVIAAHAGAGCHIDGNSAMLYDQSRSNGLLHKSKRPKLGDVVFFDNTYDRNGNGRRDDDLTHVGVVEAVDQNGTITVVHLGSKGIVRIRMNLRHPHIHKSESGAVYNDFLRASKNKDNGPVLAGELFKAFGSLWKADEEAARAVADSSGVQPPMIP